MTGMRTVIRGAVVAAVSVLVAASAVACGKGAAPATPEVTATLAVTPSPVAGSPTPDLTPTPPPSAPSPTPAPTPTPTPTPEAFEGTRSPAQGEGTAPVPPGALLVQVRYGRHENFDRIVFQFENGLSGYRIEYVQPPIVGDFSGLPVDIAGSAFLRAHFSVAAAHDPSTGDRTYLGPLELRAGLPSLLEAEAKAERFRANVDARNGLGLYFWLRLGYRPARPDEVPGGPQSGIMPMMRTPGGRR